LTKKGDNNLDLFVKYSFILMGLIACSAFFSSAETAYSSAKTIRLKRFAHEGRSGAKRALYITENFSVTITTILVLNNVVNIGSASIATYIFSMYSPDYGTLISTVVMTILVLIFGEILPKNYAKNSPEKYAMMISGVMYFFITISKPITNLFVKLNNIVSNFYRQEDSPMMTEDELIEMLSTIEKEGVIEEEERELIKSAIEFDETPVKEICTPRKDIIGIDISNMSSDYVNKLLLNSKVSRLPVYENSLDNIVGILREREYLYALVKGTETSVKEMMIEPIHVAGSMKISVVLEMLQRNTLHMAIVVDEHGGTIGLVTLEDLLEELVGEIYDETDEVPELISETVEGEFLVDADANLNEFFEEYFGDVSIPKTDFPTIGGWCFETFECIAKNGDSFQYEGITIEVEVVENIRIKSVKVYRNQEGEGKEYVKD
jgi:CBS domain containing-hemolysin-like protein